jgi:hypothetical protein
VVVGFRKQFRQFRQALLDVGKKLGGVLFPVFNEPARFLAGVKARDC